jgi:ankyrin repeat protein
VQQHIAAGSNLDVRDSVGLTAVHHAAIRGDLPMIEALAAAGADLTVPNAIGKSPLDLARLNGRVAVAKFLQDRPASKGGGRGLVDGGLGVSGVLDSQ